MTVAAPPVAPVLSVRGLSCRFGQTRALRAVDLDVHHGEVVALLGQNGAGKSTLIKILAGVQRPTAGTISIGGRVYERGLHARESHAAGLAFVHQDLGLTEELSVAENIAHVAGFVTHRGLISWRRQRALAAEVLSRWGFEIDPRTPVRALDPVQRALTAISRALATDARMLVLDEPTAALHRHEVEILFGAVDRLRAGGVAVLYVTHRLGEVARLADRVVVLRDGERVADLPQAELSDERMVELIVGRDAAQHRDRERARPMDEAALELVDAGAARVGPVSLRVHRGEIVALVGLVGAGHGAVGRLVAGAEPLRRGTMRVGGRPYRPRSPRHALARRVAYLPGDRLGQGSFPGFSAGVNLWARPRPDEHWLRPAAERASAGRVLREWAVSPADPGTRFGSLSGGNQQRVLLGKWIETGPLVLVVDEPTAGVDVGGRAALYERLRAAARAGVATVLVSADAEEVAALANRVLVFGDGRPVAELGAEQLSVDRITLECARA